MLLFEKNIQPASKLLQALLQVETLIFNKRLSTGVSVPVKKGIFCLLETDEFGTKKRRLH